MPKQSLGVIPIRRDRGLDDDAVDLAYALWLASGFRNGSAEENLSTALRKFRGTMSAVLVFGAQTQFGWSDYPANRDARARLIEIKSMS